MRWCRTGTSSGTRIWFWARIVSSASCPRSSSAQYQSVPRRARFRAAFPAARLSPLVAGRSCSAAGDGAGLGELDSVMKHFFDVAATGTGKSAIAADRLCTCYPAHIPGTRPPETAPPAQIQTISTPGPARAAGLLAVRIRRYARKVIIQTRIVRNAMSSSSRSLPTELTCGARRAAHRSPAGGDGPGWQAG